MARLASRKYVQVDTVESTKVVALGSRRLEGALERTYAILHRDGCVMARLVMTKDSAYTEFRTSRDGMDHMHTRYHELKAGQLEKMAEAVRTGAVKERIGIGFDEGHLKRVADTVMRDVVNFKKEQKNLLLSRRAK